MGAAAVPALITGGLGLIGAKAASDQAGRAANKAQKSQDELVRRQKEAYDFLKSVIDQQKQRGAFDPSVALQRARADINQNVGMEKANEAGADRIAGYAPGDSEPEHRQDAITAQGRLAMTQTLDAIRRNAQDREFNAYSALNGGSASLNSGIGAYGNQQQIALGQQQGIMQGIGGFFNQIQPYLNPSKTVNPRTYNQGVIVGSRPGRWNWGQIGWH